MGQDDSWVSTTLKTRFTQFQQNPFEPFAVRLRQLRSELLRQLLANPATITLEIFNREVWSLGSVIVNGRTIPDLLVMDTGIDVAQLPELMTALDQGKFEIHGNAIWGSGSRIFGAQLKESNDEKTQLIQQALVILNDATLSPLVKAQRIDKVPGFGPNISTGLVMVFHPTEFAIFNEPSQSAMHTLGNSFQNLEEFEEKALALKEQLGAIDCLELDRFLYLVYKGHIQLDHPNHQVLQPTDEHKQTWLFQANPKVWIGFSENFKQQTAGATGDWTVTTHGKEMHPGDRVLIWEAGPKAGLLAIGELTGEPFERKVPLRYTHILTEPIPRATFLQDPVLKNMQHIRAPQGSNFTVTQEEWEALQKLINQHPDATPTALPIGFAEVYQRILEQGLDFSYELVANYLLALQTKRFVILTGISGTGKTQLAMAVAHCFDRSSLITGSTESMLMPKNNGGNAQPTYSRLVAVRPDWRDNRGLLGYYNPLLERYSVTPMLHLLLCAQEEFEAALREGREAIPFFIILDEMNLARVEHYFSDFLSSLESGEPLDLQEHPSKVMDETGGTMIVPAQLKIHNNVFFTGTVNIDETTYMFSPKVLDRAFTLELNEVNLATFGQRELEREGDITPLYLHHFPGRLNYDHKPNTTDWKTIWSIAQWRVTRRSSGFECAAE